MMEKQMASDLAEIFRVMADPTRLQILAILLRHEQRVSDIAAALDMSVAAVSHQLHLLRQMRLVRWRRAGREIHYALDDDHIETLFRAGLEHVNHG